MQGITFAELEHFLKESRRSYANLGWSKKEIDNLPITISMDDIDIDPFLGKRILSRFFVGEEMARSKNSDHVFCFDGQKNT